SRVRVLANGGYVRRRSMFVDGLLVVPAIACVLALAVRPTTGQPPASPEEKLPAILTPEPMKAAPGDDELRKLLIARYNAAVAEMQARYREFLAGRSSLDSMIEPARHLMDSQLEVTEKPADQIAVREKYLELMKGFEKLQQARFEAARIPTSEVESARYLRLDAEVQLLKAK